MTTLANIITDAATGTTNLYAGTVATTADDASVEVYVTIPAFDQGDRRFGPCKYIPKGELPARGDACLVAFDEADRPWIAVWWNGSTVSGGGGGGDPTGAAGGDLTGTFPNPTLIATGTAGTYTKVTTDSKGRVTSGENLSAGDLPAHTHTLSNITDAGTAAAKNYPAAGNAGSTEVVLGSDTRLSDARTPLSHTHTLSAITDAGTAAAKDAPAAGNASSGQVVLGSDTRLTDSRAPSGSAGGDLTGTYPNPTIGSGKVTSTHILDGTIVNADINASAAIALSKLATDPLARANHTGTQIASTISDFDTQVRTSRLDQMAAPTASVGMNAQRITNVATPTNPMDAVTKTYVDNATATATSRAFATAIGS